MSDYHNSVLEKKDKHNYAPQNFCELNQMTANSDSAGNFHARIRNSYSNYFATANSLTIAQYGIRYYRSKKLVYSSAQMREEAKISKAQGLLVSYHFLMYYALLHAMQSCLVLSTDIDDEKVLNLSHTKIRTYFKNYFSDVQCCPMDNDIIVLFDKLRKLREYFSYAMPFNVCDWAVISEDTVDHYLRACYQLDNLMLCILNTLRHSVSYAYSDYNELKQYFMRSCNRLGEDELTDDANYFFWKEFRDYGGTDMPPISVAFDHDFDEYGTYDFSYYKKSGIDRLGSSFIISKTLSAIYNAVI